MKVQKSLAIPTKTPADQIRQTCKSMPVQKNPGHAVHLAIRTDLAVAHENRGPAVEVVLRNHVPDREAVPKSHHPAVEVAPGNRTGRVADRENPDLVHAAEADQSTPIAADQENQVSAAEVIPDRVRMWVLRNESVVL